MTAAQATILDTIGNTSLLPLRHVVPAKQKRRDQIAQKGKRNGFNVTDHEAGHYRGRAEGDASECSGNGCVGRPAHDNRLSVRSRDPKRSERRRDRPE